MGVLRRARAAMLEPSGPVSISGAPPAPGIDGGPPAAGIAGGPPAAGIVGGPPAAGIDGGPPAAGVSGAFGAAAFGAAGFGAAGFGAAGAGVAGAAADGDVSAAVRPHGSAETSNTVSHALQRTRRPCSFSDSRSCLPQTGQGCMVGSAGTGTNSPHPGHAVCVPAVSAAADIDCPHFGQLKLIAMR